MDHLNTHFRCVDQIAKTGEVVGVRPVGVAEAIAHHSAATAQALRVRGEEDGGLIGEVSTSIVRVVPVSPQLRPPR